MHADGELALVKEAYIGEPSRPVFPVTSSFATKSTNSWVALNSSIRIIQNTRQIEEGVSYYSCSNKVQSELCVPILRQNLNSQVWEVIGIIDLESWKPRHFDNQLVCDVLNVAFHIGESNKFAILPS
jgi:putative methionine-R-sulfoxide reductase with GAF domain